MYTLFTFKSGCNPFVAFTDCKRKEILRLFARKGYGIKHTAKDIYMIDDRR